MEVGPFRAPSYDLNIGNLMHRSVFPDNFSSSFSQKMHSAGNSQMTDDGDDLREERIVEPVSLGITLNFNQSCSLVILRNSLGDSQLLPNLHK